MDNELEVMRVIRVPPRGQLVVQIGKNRYERISDIPNEALERLVLAAVGELVVFADGYNNLVAADVAPPLVDRSGEKGDAYAESLEERQAAFLAALEEQRDAELVPPPPEPVPKTPAPEEEIEPLSIVDQINPLLQKQIDADPELRGRSVHLEDGPAGALVINVDGQLYERPEHIEDARVKKAISAALKEWDST